jgi:hypothetical protein
MPTSTDRTTVIPTRVTVVPADPVTAPAHVAGSSTAPAVTPPTWSGRKTAVVAALAIGFASVGAVGAAAAIPDQTAATGRTGPGGFPGGFPGGTLPGGQNGVPGAQVPGGTQNNQGAQGAVPGPGWHHDRAATGSQGYQPGQLPVLPQAPSNLGGTSGQQEQQGQTT